MKKKSRGRSIDTIFVIIIFATFAFSVLMVLALGAGIYKNINDITRENESERTALSYVRTKVRNLDNAGSVYIADFNGKPALFIKETLNSGMYNTVIYIHDGWLCEIFNEEGFEIKPQNGMRIVQIDNMHFEQQDGGTIRINAGDIYAILTPRSTA